jgi:hypothetical protein
MVIIKDSKRGVGEMRPLSNEQRNELRVKFYEILGKIEREPNHEEFEYRGFKCLVRRFMESGVFCGYVGLPEGHKYFGKEYDNIPINVHGGLTYAGHDIGDDKTLFYIGFDCDHYMDIAPFRAFSNLSYLELIEYGNTYKDIQYVREQIKGMVDQLLDDDMKTANCVPTQEGRFDI